MKAKNQTKEMKQLRKAMWELFISILEFVGAIAFLIAVVKWGLS